MFSPICNWQGGVLPLLFAVMNGLALLI